MSKQTRSALHGAAWGTFCVGCALALISVEAGIIVYAYGAALMTLRGAYGDRREAGVGGAS